MEYLAVLGEKKNSLIAFFCIMYLFNINNLKYILPKVKTASALPTSSDFTHQEAFLDHLLRPWTIQPQTQISHLLGS